MMRESRRIILPFGNIGDDLECLLDTFVCNLRTFLELGVVGIPIET